MRLFDKLSGKKEKNLIPEDKVRGLMKSFKQSNDFYVRRNAICELEAIGDKYATEMLAAILTEEINEAIFLYSYKIFEKEEIFKIERDELMKLPSLSGETYVQLSGLKAKEGLVEAMATLGSAMPEKIGSILRARNHSLELSLICAKSLLKIGAALAVDYIKIALALVRHRIKQDRQEMGETDDAELRDLTVFEIVEFEKQIKIIEDGLLKIQNQKERMSNGNDRCY